VNALAAVQKLKALGYYFQVEGDALRYEWHGSGKPPSQARPLLEAIKGHKRQVISYLVKQKVLERVLTCADCSYFEANRGPNPREGWDHCRKQNKGRYGIGMACTALVHAESYSEKGDVRH